MGKAVRKLAKDETQDELYYCLTFLHDAYSNLGLYWAANSCLVATIQLYANEWYVSGRINERFYKNVEKLLRNEMIIGRLPVLLAWYELFNVLKNFSQTDSFTNVEELSTRKFY